MMKPLIYILLLLLLLQLPFLVAAQNISSYVDSGLIYDPNGIAFDQSGNLFVATGLGNTILKVDTSKMVTVIAGTGVTGFGGDNNQATNALLNQPCGIAVDKFGNILFTDAGNSRIRKIDKTTGIITTIAGISTGGIGSGGYSGDNGPATAAELNGPSGIYFDKNWNLYFADNNRVRRIDTSGIIITIAGNGDFGVTYGDGGPATAAECVPHGICVDNNYNVYFTQDAGAACSVRKIGVDNIITTVAGDSALWMYNGDNIPATAAHLSPFDVKTNSHNDVFVSDINRVREIDDLGIIHTIAGNGVAGYSGDGGPATSAEMYNISFITFDSCDNLYISMISYGNHIRKVSFNPTCLPLKIPETPPAQLAIYPNPATSELNIDNITSEANYALFNVLGIIEQSGTLQKGNNTINIKSLSAGLYLLELIDDDGKRTVKKIVKE